jgi:hypothetical protein
LTTIFFFPAHTSHVKKSGTLPDEEKEILKSAHIRLAVLTIVYAVGFYVGPRL